jgi:Uncharacterized alpha/beta hydrolase domain (DUF2235)
MGDGLFQKVQDGYAFLSYVWDPGDDIFLFGFSRGAYIARSLAGMIAFLGVQNKNLDNQTVREIFCAYRLTNHAQRLAPKAALTAEYALTGVHVRMTGVWDTVGAFDEKARDACLSPRPFNPLGPAHDSMGTARTSHGASQCGHVEHCQTPLRGDAKVPAIKSLLGRLLNSRCSQTPRAMIIQGRSEEGRLGRPSRRLPDFHNLVNDCGPVCHGDPYQDCLDW